MTTAAQFKLNQAINGAQVRSRPWSVEAAYGYCEQLARSHYENFPVGSILLPGRLRKHFYSIYAFARTADDFADEGLGGGISAEQRIALLDEWREMLSQAFAGRATHPVFIALGRTQSEFRLPITLFEDLLSAFVQDVSVRRYQSYDDLLDYCRRSANPVGRLILMLFGYRDDHRHLLSDNICTALQLTNHWQDVGIDLDKGRIYLPAEDLERFGVCEQDITARKMTRGFEQLMGFEVERARELFARGKSLCTSVGGRLGLELRLVWLGGSRILDDIERSGYDVFSRRPRIGRREKLQILCRAVGKGQFGRI